MTHSAACRTPLVRAELLRAEIPARERFQDERTNLGKERCVRSVNSVADEPAKPAVHVRRMARDGREVRAKRLERLSDSGLKLKEFAAEIGVNCNTPRESAGARKINPASGHALIRYVRTPWSAHAAERARYWRRVYAITRPGVITGGHDGWNPSKTWGRGLASPCGRVRREGHRRCCFIERGAWRFAPGR